MNEALQYTISRKLISSSRLIKALSIIASVCIFFLLTFTPAVAGFLIDADFETGETLSSVDKDNHRITLTSTVTYSNGDAVNLPYSGAAPTAGVVQIQDRIPAPPMNLGVR